MGAGRPKQFLELDGRPVLDYSLERFHRQDFGGLLCVVAPANYIEETTQLVIPRVQSAQLVPGGADRHRSTLAGLQKIWQSVDVAASADDLILIHDVARPLVQADELDRLLAAFHADPGVELASLAAPATETLVRGSGLPARLRETVDRSEFFAVKTPQAARLGVLHRRAAAEADPPAYTDLLTWGAAHGIRGLLVEAGPLNHKLTHAADLAWLSSLRQRDWSG